MHNNTNTERQKKEEKETGEDKKKRTGRRLRRDGSRNRPPNKLSRAEKLWLSFPGVSVGVVGWEAALVSGVDFWLRAIIVI